jgi:hypothetical protein
MLLEEGDVMGRLVGELAAVLRVGLELEEELVHHVPQPLQGQAQLGFVTQRCTSAKDE